MENQTIKESLTFELEETRSKYHALLDELTQADWDVPSGNPAWTIGEVMVHLALGLQIIPAEVQLIQSGVSYPLPPLNIFNTINLWIARQVARRYNIQTVGAYYDREWERVLAALEATPESDFQKSGPYPPVYPPFDQGQVTIEDLFRMPAYHFQLHASQVHQGLAVLNTPSEAEVIPYQPHFSGLLTYPSAGWARFFFKAPLVLYRMGLGPLLGQVMVVFSHTGRKSGKTYHTMTEYVRFNDQVYVPVGFGPKSDWYQNLLADPRTTYQTTGKPHSAMAVRVTVPAELLSVIELARRREPPLIEQYFASLGIDGTPQDILAKRERIYWLRFDPVSQPTPAPLKIDLVWVWPALLAFFSFVWLLRRRRK